MTLLKWALICFVISLIAGGLGFTGIASGAGSLRGSCSASSC